MTTQDIMKKADIVAQKTEPAADRSPVCGDALWRLPVTVCRITDFLGPEVSQTLLDRVTALGVGSLQPSTVRSTRDVDTRIRRSRTNHSFEAAELLSAIEEVREVVEHTLGLSCENTVPLYGLNVHNDGDFYGPHQDCTHDFQPDRVLTFVYYLNRSPRPFQGGDLRVYDISLPVSSEGKATWESRTWRDYEPQHDSIVFFRPSAWHEVRPVSCPSKQHEDSRFAINGWMTRLPAE
ncbi:2OG-Fe(II) oxygenase [Streptomyces sp. NBC_00690]|uniref:2OG-Fe(II) oxygenase n=1 Tax=Streptomyces sp. NBC_00690 TaxID=2975808 RepID=UPI002E282D48|nr:2OG-Fe(II) oxygenase [Streptomyces sp. NBC_00690]